MYHLSMSPENSLPLLISTHYAFVGPKTSVFVPIFGMGTVTYATAQAKLYCVGGVSDSTVGGPSQFYGSSALASLDRRRDSDACG
jgi:hypothetical protein